MSLHAVRAWENGGKTPSGVVGRLLDEMSVRPRSTETVSHGAGAISPLGRVSDWVNESPHGNARLPFNIQPIGV